MDRSKAVRAHQGDERRIIVAVILLALVALVLGGAILGYLLTRPEPAPPPGPVPLLPNTGAIDVPRPEWHSGQQPVAAGREPVLWDVSNGYECRDYQGREVCEGPRRVPLPLGEPARLAEKLGLGTRQTARTLLGNHPPLEWQRAVWGDHAEAFHWPVRGGKLWRGLSNTHRGVDIGGDLGAHIFAVSDGLVAYSDNGVGGYGNIALVIHPDSKVAMYAHCRSVWVFAGQLIKAGQIIGEVGDTGITRGYHLHFELRNGGKPEDPLPLFSRWKAFNARPPEDGGAPGDLSQR